MAALICILRGLPKDARMTSFRFLKSTPHWYRNSKNTLYGLQCTLIAPCHWTNRGRCLVGPEPGHERALHNLQHYQELILEEEEELQRSRQVIVEHPQLRNARVLDGVRALPEFDAYERLCRGELLPRNVRHGRLLLCVVIVIITTVTNPPIRAGLRWRPIKPRSIGTAGLRNVRTCSAEQGPQHFRGPKGVCQKILCVQKLPIGKK